MRDTASAGACPGLMTPAAQEFVGELSFQALSGHPVHTELLDAAAESGMGHIELARWADMVVVAPASADFMARLAHGHADDLAGDIGPELDGGGYEDGELFEMIYMGIPDGGMPPYSKLGAKKVWFMVNFIQERK